MLGPYIHAIDPILVKIGPVYLWWYGLGYALGFLEIYVLLKRARSRIGLTVPDVYNLTLFFVVGVLVGGRAIEVAFDEWPFYRHHLWLVPAYWLGGMASHGILLGGAVGVWLFARIYRKPFLSIADELVIPSALLLGLGRIGNFIDGQIVGSVTDVPWGVKFPDAEGFRHPVVLYDGAKNLLLIPLLLWIRRAQPVPGAAAAHFVFWYAFLRIPVDLFREYPTHRLGVATGQCLNVVMSMVGALSIIRSKRKLRRARLNVGTRPAPLLAARFGSGHLAWKRATLASLVGFSLTMPSNWTQDVPGRYGMRHQGLRHSFMYPRIETAPPIRSGLPQTKSKSPDARSRRATEPQRKNARLSAKRERLLVFGVLLSCARTPFASF